MIRYLEEEKDGLIEGLRTAETPDKCRPVMERALDRVLMKSSGELESSRMQAAASGMIQVLKAAVPLADTVRDVRIWQRAGREKKDRRSVFLIPAGIVLIAAALLVIALQKETPAGAALTVSAVLASAGAILFYLAGRQRAAAAPESADGTERKEYIADADRIYRVLHAALLTADRNLEDAASEEAWETAHREDTADSLPPDWLQLCSDLLEAAYSGDAEFAFGRLEEIRYFLHGRKIDVVDYSEETAQYFDRMPSSAQGTLRPALLCEGRLVKKGLAAL